MTSSFLLDDRVAAAELMAARLDGDVQRIGDAHAPVDLRPTPELRARALTGATPPDAVVEGRAAAWVHGVLPWPRTVVVGRPRSTRPARAASTVVVRQVAHRDEDVVRIGPLRITTPLRTALDLVRTESRLDLRTATAVATLLAADGCTAAQAGAALAGRGGLPHRRRALLRLAELGELISLL